MPSNFIRQTSTIYRNYSVLRSIDMKTLVIINLSMVWRGWRENIWRRPWWVPNDILCDNQMSLLCININSTAVYASECLLCNTAFLSQTMRKRWNRGNRVLSRRIVNLNRFRDICSIDFVFFIDFIYVFGRSFFGIFPQFVLWPRPRWLLFLSLKGLRKKYCNIAKCGPYQNTRRCGI